MKIESKRVVQDALHVIRFLAQAAESGLAEDRYPVVHLAGQHIGALGASAEELANLAQELQTKQKLLKDDSAPEPTAAYQYASQTLTAQIDVKTEQLRAQLVSLREKIRIPEFNKA